LNQRFSQHIAPITHGISALAAASVGEQFEVPLEMSIDFTQRSILTPEWSEFGDALAGGN